MAQRKQSTFTPFMISFLYLIACSHIAAFAWIGDRVRGVRNVVAPKVLRWQTAFTPQFSSICAAVKQSDASDQKYSAEQTEINSRIYSVASTICNLSAEQLTIEWKPTRIVVTVNVDQAYIDAIDEDDDSFTFEDEFFEEDVAETEEIEDLGGVVDDTIDEALDLEAEKIVDDGIMQSNGVDLTLLARSINAALDDDGQIGSQIAERYEIEVTTPGVSDELTTPVMFAAYRGFDVLVQHQDPKTKKIKTFEGRLVEKNADFVVLNIKGRMKHLKNSDVLTVKLPKAKKEKGVG